MSCAKVTAMVFPTVVNPRDVNKYRRITMSDSPRGSDAESLSESAHREDPIKYEMDSSLTGMKLSKGSQTDIMMEPPHYPPPPPPNQPPKGKRKVRMSENPSDECDNSDTKETVNQCFSRCENCANDSGPAAKLDEPVENEPVSGTESPSVVHDERRRDPPPAEDSCAMECLYYAVHCSDCTLL